MKQDFDAVSLDLLSRPLLAQLAYEGHDGYPRSVPVWFEYRDGEILIESGASSYKSRRIRHGHDRVAVTIATPEAPYLGLVVLGDASVELLEEDPRRELIGGMASRYLSEESAARYLESVRGPSALLRVRPARYRSWDYTGYF
jgi:hypothetical protein